MTLLTQRARHVFSVLEAYRGANDDIVDALLPFFEPILGDLTGRTYVPLEFAERVRGAYRWSFTPDIAEELIPRFQARGWLKEIGRTGNDRAFQITYVLPAKDNASAPVLAIDETLRQIATAFHTFIQEISPLTSYNRTTDELSEILIEWLVSIDAYSDEVLRQQVRNFDITNTGKLAVAENALDDASQLPNEDKYLCARFIKKLHKENSPWLQDLCRIASIGLLTEVIQDFTKPTSAVKKSDLAIYLDGPVALDVLGLSGKAASENIRPIIGELNRIGCQVRVFRATVEELQRALRVMLSRHPNDRVGATADAIRRGEVLERYAASVRDDSSKFLKEQGIAILDQTLEQFPSSHEYFTAEMNTDLYGAINWHHENAPRIHDTTVLTLVMRRRGDNQSRDAFQTKHLFVTRSGYLGQVARRFCIERKLIERYQVPPAIHQRQLATMTWLRTGLGTAQEVPKRYLLAACERVLELKRGIVEKARHAVANLSSEQQQQLELLLGEDRSVQMMLDKTLGSSAVINENNMPQLLEAMKKSLTSEIERGKRKEVTSIRKEASAKIRVAEAARQTAEERARTAEDRLVRVGEDDRGIVEGVVEIANRSIRRFRWCLNGVGSLIVFGILALPLAIEMQAGSSKYALLLILGLLSAAMARYQIWDRKIGLRRLVRRFAERTLVRLVAERRLEDKLEAYPVAFVEEEMLLKPAQPVKITTLIELSSH